MVDACSTQAAKLFGLYPKKGAIQLGSRPEWSGKRIIVIMPDSGERYVSLPFFTP